MGDRDVPASLSEVIAPLREADEYTRLQTIRQRGLYNVLTGLPLFSLVVAWLSTPFGFDVAWREFRLTLFILGWTLFFVSSFPRLLLPLVRRHRPDWQASFLEAGILKKGLERQFWTQFLFLMAWAVTVPLLAIIVLLPAVSSDPPGMWQRFTLVSLLTQALSFAFLLAANLTLAWQARRAGDTRLSSLFLAWIPVGLVALLLDPTSQSPSPFAAALLMVALTTPPILVGLARLFAPRRWLL